jgi:tetratricopeptide (TPR) repeat protein
VYQAWDETLATAVALKLIRADDAVHPIEIQELESRFKRELKLARQISHPNVIRIHDLGEVGRTLYITMALVQGGDLARLIQRSGRLPAPRALMLARQIASGLEAAHRAGVVHRDLKPANILVDDEDHACLTDFGIARSSKSATLHTLPGSLIGTLEYMAPEQARGEAVTERADIYTFGLILYEMLAGGRPRRAGTGGLEDLIARIETGPPALATVVEDIPPDLERIVTRCLDKAPDRRYATATDLLADLDRLDENGRARIASHGQVRWKKVAAAAATAAALVAATWWTAARFASPPSVPADRDTVTVLIADFENRSGNPVFTGALEQALSVAMEGASFISAYPRTDAARLTTSATTAPGRLTDENARLVALREGIHVVLAGSIEQSTDGFQLALRQLTPAGELLASVTERATTPTEVLTAIGRLAEKIRRALGDQTPSEQVLAETFTAANFDAVRAYTTAQQLSQNQKDEEAVGHYRRAIAADRDFGRAYSGLAASLSDLGQKKEAESMWKEAIDRIDRMTPREKLRTLGGYYMQVANDYPMAIETYKQLVQKYPADSAGHNNLAVALFQQLDFDGALQEGQKAIAVYPRSFKYRVNYALYAMYAGDVKTATATAQRLLEEDPAFASAFLPLAMSALLTDDVSGARQAYDRAAAATGDEGRSLAAIGLADIAIFEGRPADAIARLPAAIKADLAKKDDFNAVAKSVALADAQAASGDMRAALATIATARQISEEDKVLVTQALLAVRTNRFDEARTIALELGKRLPAQSRAYARLIEAEIARANGNHGDALTALQAGIALADLWLLRYSRGLVYLHAGPGSAPQALAELTGCETRSGEATAAFLDDLPTYRYAAELPYWIGRAREALNQDPSAYYQKYVTRRQAAADDRLLDDARRRLAARSR